MEGFFAMVPDLIKSLAAGAIVLCAVEFTRHQSGKQSSKFVSATWGLMAVVAIVYSYWQRPLGAVVFLSTMVLFLVVSWPLLKKL
ncbi:hypothetical protein [Gloeobacter morelensis]|uniref:Uncharacterized protein n=1 Tax=Gloeobacter morelensis MG652769 TaxID=2781736 RepID=A0ABY3PIE8_9CYAN|nr:hypothetical protein [Gloeobacter morelensis]UFP93394.1 hypothetical protein ISF26_16530 [Gloeobacter morelensis MG652769]